ncbi:hypothetical protein HDU76_004115 [Blyttiomyces sp. JEL0837]|nr:hypothetical protein HDU76_004115 [Blyttiomyces sp. JEL0837]
MASTGLIASGSSSSMADCWLPAAPNDKGEVGGVSMSSMASASSNINMNTQEVRHRRTQSNPTVSALSLPMEILEMILRLAYSTSEFPNHNVGPEVDDTRLARNLLMECALVCQKFYYASQSVLWHQPYFTSIHSFSKFIKWCNREIKFKLHHQQQQQQQQQSPSSQHQHQHQLIGHLGTTLIRDVDITKTPHLSTYVSPIHLSIFLSLSPSPCLTRLTLQNCKSLTDITLIQIASTTSTTLSSLDLSGCIQITDVGVSMACEMFGNNNSNSGKRLEELRLRRCGLLSDLGLVEIGKWLGGCLKVLDLSYCYRISDRGIFAFLKRVESERGRGRRGCGNNSNNNNSKMTAGVVNSGGGGGNGGNNEDEVVVDDEDARLRLQESLGKVSGRMEEFRFAGSRTGSRKVTRIDFVRILECLKAGNPGLKVLEFTVPPAPKGSPTQVYTSFPVKSLKGLQTVHIYNAKLLPLEVIRHLSFTLASTIRHLTLTSLTITMEGYLDIFSQCEFLESICFAKGNVNDDVLVALKNAGCCGVLKKLDVSLCPFVTDVGICALVKPVVVATTSATAANGDGDVTMALNDGGEGDDGDDGIQVGVPALPNLEELNVSEIPQITHAALLVLIGSYAPPRGRLVRLNVTGNFLGTDWHGYRKRVWDEFLLKSIGKRGVSIENGNGGIGGGGDGEGLDLPDVLDWRTERFAFAKVPEQCGVSGGSEERLYRLTRRGGGDDGEAVAVGGIGDVRLKEGRVTDVVMTSELMILARRVVALARGGSGRGVGRGNTAAAVVGA